MNITLNPTLYKPYYIKLLKNYLPIGSSYVSASEAIDSIQRKSHGAKRIYVPVNFDTEYKDVNYGQIQKPKRRQLVSKQLGTANKVYPFQIYSEQERHLPYHPITELGAGIGIEVEWSNSVYLEQSIVFAIYSHFQTVELDYIFNGQMRDIWESNYLSDESKITTTKRVQITRPKNTKGTYSLNIPELQCNLDGQLYNFELILVDTVGLHGAASYKALLENTGITTTSKNLIELCKAESGLLELPYNPIENMDKVIVDYPKSFDEYALGDLKLTEILDNNNSMFSHIKSELGIPESWHNPPALTTGATVAEIIEQCIFNKLDLEWTNFKTKSQIRPVLFDGNPQSLFDRGGTAGLLSKTFGGRCQNASPTLLAFLQIIADMDEDGCYGAGQMLQQYPIGTPEALTYSLSGKNTYMTLRQWLKAYKGDLVPGLWTAIVDTLERPLTFEQDFIPSWFVTSSNGQYSPAIKNYLKLQKEFLENGSEDSQIEVQDYVKDGQSKIFTNQIKCGVITHDTVQWIEHVCTPQHRKELLDNVYVLSSAVYPKSTQCEDFEDFKAKLANHKGTRSIKRGKGQIVTTDRNHTFWFPMKLKEIIIETSLVQRKRYPKKSKEHFGKKHPLNELWKLITNTTYGVIASPFFAISNSIVANNITARARAFGWYFEKACIARGVITDGDLVMLNRVLFASGKARINGHNMVDMREIIKPNGNNFYTGPIGGQEIKYSHTGKDKEGKPLEYYYRGDTLMSSKELMGWLNKVGIPEHIQSHFSDKIDAIWMKRPKLIVNASGEAPDYPLEGFEYVEGTGYFDWECKEIYQKATFHGASNYYLENTVTNKVSMRAYQDSQHWDYNGVNDVSPARHFLSTLESHIDLPEPMLQTSIIKLKDYQSGRFGNLTVGDTCYKSVHIKPLSLSQFKFQTIKQFLTWDKQRQFSHDHFGIYLEYFYMESGQLNYQAMIKDVWEIIKLGVKDPIKHLGHKVEDIKATAQYKTRQQLRYDVGLSDKLYLECPKCGSTDFKKNGFDRDNVQQYQCKSCGCEYKPTHQKVKNLA